VFALMLDEVVHGQMEALPQEFLVSQHVFLR
jgi:hypothetical protein